VLVDLDRCYARRGDVACALFVELGTQTGVFSFELRDS
jgi:hypothetical protein